MKANGWYWNPIKKGSKHTFPIQLQSRGSFSNETDGVDVSMKKQYFQSYTATEST